MGEDEPNLTRAHFSDGLVQPPTSDSLRYTFSQFKFVASLECVRGPAAKVAKDGGDVVSIHALETLKLSVLKGCFFFFSFQNHFSLSIPKGGWMLFSDFWSILHVASQNIRRLQLSVEEVSWLRKQFEDNWTEAVDEIFHCAGGGVDRNKTGGRRFFNQAGKVKKIWNFSRNLAQEFIWGASSCFLFFVFFSQEGLCFLNRHLFFEVIREIVVLCCERMFSFLLGTYRKKKRF